jgi:excisionase family DNA binding protein
MLTSDAQSRKTYDVAEAGRLLGLGRNATYEAIRRGDIPTIRVGKRILVLKVALDRMLNGEAAA